MSYVVLKRVSERVSLVFDAVFGARQEALDALRSALFAGRDDGDAEYVVLDIDSASPVLLLPVGEQEPAPSVPSAELFEEAFIPESEPVASVDGALQGTEPPVAGFPMAQAPVEILVEEIILEPDASEEIEAEIFEDEAEVAETMLEEALTEVAAEGAAISDVDEVAQALEELLPDVGLLEDIDEVDFIEVGELSVEAVVDVAEEEEAEAAGTEIETPEESGAETGETAGAEEQPEVGGALEVAVEPEPEPMAQPAPEAEVEQVGEPRVVEETVEAPEAPVEIEAEIEQAAAVAPESEPEPEPEPEPEMPGYAAGESDLESLTCDDCVYVTTCPNKEERTPSACGSFQWVSV